MFLKNVGNFLKKHRQLFYYTKYIRKQSKIYTEENLITYGRNFHYIRKKIPTHSDIYFINLKPIKNKNI